MYPCVFPSSSVAPTSWWLLVDPYFLRARKKYQVQQRNKVFENCKNASTGSRATVETFFLHLEPRSFIFLGSHIHPRRTTHGTPSRAPCALSARPLLTWRATHHFHSTQASLPFESARWSAVFFFAGVSARGKNFFSTLLLEIGRAHV